MARLDPRNRATYWWDRHVPGLSLLDADFTDHEYAPHSHEALVVAVTEDGGSIIRSRGVIEEARPSELFVFNPAEPHAGWMGKSRRWRYRSLYLTQSAIDAVTEGLGLDRMAYFTRNMVPDRDLIRGFLRLHRALEAGRDPFEERELLVGSFGVLLGRHGSGGARIEPPPRDRARLDAVLDLIGDRFADSLRLEDLAVVAGLTTFQLIGLFKRTVGLTPHAWLTQVRLNEASRLLRRAEPPAVGAAAAGSYDQSALSRHFKRCYGITPRQFATAAQA